MNGFKKYGGVVVRLATLLGLVLHFTATLLYVFPLNPVKMELGFFANITIGAYFPQNWSLFAPTPVQSTQALMVRCLLDEEVPRDSETELPADGWQNISAAHFAQAQRHRFSAYERLVRPLQNSLRTYLTGGPDLYPYHEACQKGDADACKVRDEAMKPRQEQSQRMLSRIGSAFCREAYPERRFEGVAIRFREALPVPWSERAIKPPVVTDYEVGVYPIDPTVTLPGLYKADVT